MSQDSLLFFFYGDWGQNVNASIAESGLPYEEKTVANQVQKFAANLKPTFFAMLGDNFYQRGVQGVQDPLWALYYRDLYTEPATNVPWYPIFGNHDYYGKDPQAQIDYYEQRIDHRWTFPDYQYTRQWSIPGGKTLEIVFINTVTLCPKAEASADKIGWPNATEYPWQLDFYWQPTLQWIDNTLAASAADVLLVAGHYDFYTNVAGDAHKPETTCLQDRLNPLLKKYKVAAYINGHEHTNEHWYLDGMNYLTVGHGCDMDDPLSTGPVPSGVLFNKTIGGFAYMEIDDSSSMSFKYVDLHGNIIYSGTINNPRDAKHRSLRGYA